MRRSVDPPAPGESYPQSGFNTGEWTDIGRILMAKSHQARRESSDPGVAFREHKGATRARCSGGVPTVECAQRPGLPNVNGASELTLLVGWSGTRPSKRASGQGLAAEEDLSFFNHG